MLFTSPVFLFMLLPILLASYFVLTHGMRNLLLLLISLIFYAWGEGFYIAILLASIGFNFLIGLWIGWLRNPRIARAALGVAVVGNLSLLGSYKYANFLVDNLNSVLAFFSLPVYELGPVHLPLGISFFTFHALSYVVDIYRKEVPALRDPIQFALYISFFPQSIAGPIVRYGDIGRQLARRDVTRAGLAEGMARFIVGLAKKVLIADVLAATADAIFPMSRGELSPRLAWLGVICYTLQIYYDFSGYSDMAIGLAKMFGFQFRENFNYPYISRSVTEFWRRWHISLSTWFRDYLYIPMGGNRCGTARLCMNLLVVFILCGLWHGPSWTFVLWGLFHGAFLTVERLGLGRLLEYCWTPIRHAYTMLVIMVGWVLFRADNMQQAQTLLAAMAGFAEGSGWQWHVGQYRSHELMLALTVGIIGVGPVFPWLLRNWAYWQQQVGDRRWLRPVLSHVPVAVLMLFLMYASLHVASSTYSPFIYFRF